MKRDELIEREALPGPFCIGVGGGKMQIPDRLRPRRPLLSEERYFLLTVCGGRPARPAGLDQQIRIRLRDAAAEGFQCVPGNPPPRPLGESVGQAVNGHPSAHVQAGFFSQIDGSGSPRSPCSPGGSGSDGLGIGLASDRREGLGLWMVHGLGSQRADLAMDHQFIAHIEEPFHLGQVPPAAMEVSAAVVEDDFEDAAPGAGEGLVAHCDNLTRHRRLLALLKVADLAELASVFVASRRIQQQIAHSENAPFGQQACPRRTHPGRSRP